jgi:hypothetical protein
MAITSSILLSTRQRYVIQLIATAVGDSSIITTTSLTRTEETTSTAALRTVNIQGAVCNVPDNGSASGVTIRRGTSSDTLVLQLHGSSEFPGNQQYPQITAGNTSSIFVNFGLPGMLILDLRKVAGFVEPNTNVGV